MKIKYFRGSFLLAAVTVLVLGIQAQPTAQPMDNPDQNQQQSRAPLDKEDKEKPKYATDRFIVKFKSEGLEAVNEDVEYLLESNERFQDAVSDKSDSLDKLKEKHKVKKAKSLFIERHGLTTADAKKKQNDIERLSKAKHPSRSRRAPKDAVIPDLSNVYVLEVPPENDIEAIVREYQADPHVEYAQPDYLMETNMVPNDPYYSSFGSWGQSYDDLWGLKNIQAEQAWDITQGKGVVVAVVDTGLYYSHPDIAANVWTNPGEIPDNGLDDDGNGYVDDTRGWDFTTFYGCFPKVGCVFGKPPDNNTLDAHGHGTHVSGTIAAVGNNTRGIIGVAPKAKIMPVQGLNPQGMGLTSDLANAIIYAAQNGADVINNSWGCSGSTCSKNPVQEEAVRTAYSLGTVVVFAAGNSADGAATRSPQNMTNPKPVVVSSSDHLDQPSDFSNFGILVDVAAPGGDSADSSVNKAFRNILSLRAGESDMYDEDTLCVVGTKYYRARGTSMAAPHASGVAALIIAHHPSFTNEDVRQVLRASADDVGTSGFDDSTGAGRINARKALEIESVPQVKIISPVFGYLFNPQTAPVTITIMGTAAGSDFKQYELFYRRGTSAEWTPIGPPLFNPVTDGVLGTWTISDTETATYTLRLVVTTLNGLQFEDAVQVAGEIPPRQITSDPAYQISPVVDRNLIVWEDWRNNPGGYLYCEKDSCRSDFYLYDLSTNTERQIWGMSSYHDLYGHAISDNRFVWSYYATNTDPDTNLYLCTYNPATGKCPKQNLTPQYVKDYLGSTIFAEEPAISGERIVWKDAINWEDGGFDIYLYDLAAGLIHRITTDEDWQENPAISKDIIVWEDPRNKIRDTEGNPLDTNDDIYLYDLSTNMEKQITTNTSDQASPAISGNYIVWTDKRNGNWDIYFYDLATGKEQQITSDPRIQTVPAISGNNIVWMDNRNGNWDIYLYDIATGRERQITSHLENQRWPAISREQVVWHDFRNGNWDIYMANVGGSPVFQFIENRTINEGQLLTSSVSAWDPNGDALTYSALNLPSGANLSGQTFSWVPAFTQAGSYEVTFSVSDGQLSVSETATMTVVDIPNLLLNPDFEDGKINWAFPGNGSIDTTVLRTGVKSAKITGTGTINSTPRVAVIAGKSYAVSGWIKTADISNTSTTTYGARIRVQWYDSTGTLISSQALIGGLQGTKDWTRYTKTFTAPAGAVSARLQLQIYGNGTTGSAWFDSVYLGDPIVTPIPPDLVMTKVAGTSQAAPGSSITITNTVNETEKSTSDSSFYVGLYLSADSTITPTDIFLGHRYIENLAGGASSEDNTVVTIPATIPENTYYYLGAIADYTNIVKETVELNNALEGNVIAIATNLPDLVADVTGPSEITRGKYISLPTTVKNQGIGLSPTFYVGIYLSTDSTITTADTRIGYLWVHHIYPDQSLTGNAYSVAPSTLAPGIYYLGAIADYFNAVEETDETNNARAGNTIVVQ